MTAHKKVISLFRELAGESADRLSPTHFPAAANSRIAAALAASPSNADILAADHIGFHLVDWQADAAFIVALTLFPERFTDDEIREGVESFLSHAPGHVVAAARLSGCPVPDLLTANED